MKFQNNILPNAGGATQTLAIEQNPRIQSSAGPNQETSLSVTDSQATIDVMVVGSGEGVVTMDVFTGPTRTKTTIKVYFSVQLQFQ